MLFSPREQACQNMWLTPLVLRARVNVRQPSVTDRKKDRRIRVTDQRRLRINGQTLRSRVQFREGQNLIKQQESFHY